MSKIYDQLSTEIPWHIQHYVDTSFDIADRIHEIMKEKGLSQKELAKALGKQESEISKWLSGTHNFTLKTISKITEVLQEDIISVILTPKAKIPVKKQ